MTKGEAKRGLVKCLRAQTSGTRVAQEECTPDIPTGQSGVGPRWMRGLMLGQGRMVIDQLGAFQPNPGPGQERNGWLDDQGRLVTRLNPNHGSDLVSRLHCLVTFLPQGAPTGERRVLNLLTDGNVIRLNFLVLKTGRLQVNNFAIIKDMFCSILSSNIHELVLESPIANKSPSFNSCLPNSPFLCLYPCSRPPPRPCPSHKKGSLCIGPSWACTAR